MSKKSNTCLLLTLVLSFVFFANHAHADGFIHVYDEYSQWELASESQQLCAINYENGFQNMILTVGAGQLDGEKAIWIFPIPAKPDRTSINIIKGFPDFVGDDIFEEADEAISDNFDLMRVSQPYYGAVWIPFQLILRSYWGGLSGREGDGVTIHESMEKMGLTTELVTAERSEALYGYLSSKDVDLPPSSKSILDEYIGEEYSFVISWISDLEEFKNNSLAYYDYRIAQRYRSYYMGDEISKYVLSVFISFPTEKMYYPLKPTSVYGSTRIPTVIYVLGYVTPDLYPELAKDAQISYFQRGTYYPPYPHDYIADFYNGKTAVTDSDFTKIKLNTPSKLLTEDLWISDTAPIHVAAAQFVQTSGIYLGLAFFIIVSCLSSMLAGALAFRDHMPQMKNFAFLGLANFTSMIGILVISIKMRADERFSNFKNPPIEVPFKRVITTSFAIAAATTTVFIYYFLWLFGFSFRYFNLYIIIPALMAFSVCLIAVFAVMLPFVWSYYKDRMMLKFTLMFSAIFFVLTYIFEFLLRLIL